ncbi:hypothetical protein SDC9_180237 [bioreactor metagenome]|uniref:Uncharacterized protein n=1 Tax=bioreactor metagenome TaxID=1076179 RepID=A0A645H158_9ZZZZ
MAVSVWIAARNISPVEMWGIKSFLTMLSAWVPLPAPGFPMSTSLMIAPPLLHEALIVPHQHMGFQLFHGIQSHTNHNQKRSAAKIDVQAGNSDGNVWH